MSARQSVETAIPERAWYERYLVVATFRGRKANGQHDDDVSRDEYVVFESAAEARAKYDEYLHHPDLFCAHICIPILGTDYDPHPIGAIIMENPVWK